MSQESDCKIGPVSQTLNIHPQSLEQGQGGDASLSNSCPKIATGSVTPVAQYFHVLMTFVTLVLVVVLHSQAGPTQLMIPNTACATCVSSSATPPEWPYSSIESFSDPLSDGGWVRDLTHESVEPNPGPTLEEVLPGGRSRKLRQIVQSTAMVVVKQKQKKKSTPRVGAPSGIVNLRNATPLSQKQFLSGHSFNPRKDMIGYMQTLMDAERFPPVRLGGETMVQTGLTTLHQVFAMPVSATSLSVVIHPRVWNPVLLSVSTAAPYTYQTGSFAWNASTSLTLQSLAASARVVSCKLKIYTTASATNDNGTIVAGLCPRDDRFIGPNQTSQADVVASTNVVDNQNVSSSGYPITASGTSLTFGGVRATQGFNEFPSEDWTDTCPLKDGVSVFWLPQDPQSMIFSPDRIRPTTVSVQGASSFTNTVNASPIQDPFFCIAITGGATSTVNFEMFLNLEYTTTSGASSIVATEAGSMSSTQSFGIVKQVGANLQNMVVADPEGSLADKAGRLGKSILKAGVNRVSEFIFGSSDVGKAVNSFFE